MTWDAGHILSCIFAVFFAIGAIDHYRHNKWGLGECFLSGIRAFEPLFLTMAGILVLVPSFRKFLAPLLVPCFTSFGIDPSVIAGLFLGNDVGAYPLALTLTDDKAAAGFSGMLLGAVFGVNLVFTLPAALNMIRKEDRPFLFRGLLFGFITVPLGCFAGGIVLKCDISVLLKMLIPVVLVSFLSALLLVLIPEKLSGFLAKAGRAVEATALGGISIALIAEVTGLSNSDFLGSVQESLGIVTAIILILPGTYVLIRIVDRLWHRFFVRAGQKLGINETAVIGLFTSLANSIPTFDMIRDMDPKGKTLNFAFLTAGAFSFGDHLAYCCAVAPELAVPLLVTKLTAALAAVLLVLAVQHFKSRKKTDPSPVR